MGIRRNIVASYANQAYVTLVSLVAVPFYLGYMGAEAYGLVGFFTTMQAWFMLLDVGLTPTLSRETARFRGGALSADELRDLLGALEIFFGTSALVVALVVALAAPAIGSEWIQARSLPVADVSQAVMLMGLTIPLRWMSGLYRGAITGFERLGWLAGFNSLIATVRFVGVIAALRHISATPFAFFTFQLVVAALELATLAIHAHRLLPARVGTRPRPARLAALRGVLRFSVTISVTSMIWVFITQLDKLLLSRLLPLAEYGYYTLAVVVAGGITLLSAPVGQALLPTLARLEAAGDDAAALRVYRRASELVCTIAVPTALLLVFFSRTLIAAWTGNPAAAAQAGPTASLYAAGNAFMALAAFPYYLQYAKGQLRWHLIGNGLLILLLLPGIYFAASRYGAVGAGWAWLTAMSLYFFVWVAWTHHRLAPGLHPWWVGQLLRIAAASTLVALAIDLVADWPQGRAAVFAEAIGVWALIFVAACAMSSMIRAKALVLWREKGRTSWVKHG
ncbi:MAG: oligosaccharide flippase family protein [Proteobacteria bacterium]|nr:oligosaccharide flippase family protein [Pseudomonadota bacterium]